MAEPYELLRGGEGEGTEGGTRTAVRVFRFPETAFPVLDHPGIPQYRDPHPAEPDALCRRKYARRVGDGDGNGWDVVCEYNTDTTGGTIRPPTYELGTYRFGFSTQPTIIRMPVAKFVIEEWDGASAPTYKTEAQPTPCSMVQMILDVVALPVQYTNGIERINEQANHLHNIAGTTPTPHTPSPSATWGANGWFRFLGGDVSYLSDDLCKFTYRWEHDPGTQAPNNPQTTSPLTGFLLTVPPNYGGDRTNPGTPFHRRSFTQWVTIPAENTINPPTFERQFQGIIDPDGHFSLPGAQHVTW